MQLQLSWVCSELARVAGEDLCSTVAEEHKGFVHGLKG